MARRMIRRGDVYWVTYAFPHEKSAEGKGGQGARKQRPIVILQNDEDNQNAHYPLVMAAPLTTQKTDRVYQQDVRLPAGEANLQRASKVLLGLTQPFLKSQLGQRVGRVSSAKMKEIDIKLLRLFGYVKTSGKEERG